MDTETQEALSHQHSHGLWVVPLASGSFALFTHPNGHFIGIAAHAWQITEESCAQARHRATTPRVTPRPPILNLELDL